MSHSNKTDQTDRCIIFAGGGSGGHLYPGIAVARKLIEKQPDLRPLFLCTDREIDRVVLEPTGFEFITQPIVPPRKSVGGLLRFWQRWRATNDLVRHVLNERKPLAVLGLGGYAAGVAVKLAADKKRKIPAAILNPDVVPGKANLYLMRYCQRVFCGFEATLDHVPANHKDKCRVVGCPLRPEMNDLPDRAEAALRLGLDPRLNTLVVTGASQGAKTVNDAVIEVITRLNKAGEGAATLQGWQVLHLSGRDHAEAVHAEWRETGLKGRAKVVDFTPDMADVWSIADIAVSRAGASSCAELLACGVPSILMPYPYHKDMHQLANARELEKAGAAVVLEDTKDRKTNADKLGPILDSLLYDAPRRDQMRLSAQTAALPHAAALAADELIEMAQ